MTDLDYVKVMGRLAVHDGDGADPDEKPDTIWCDEGSVTFTPLTAEVQVYPPVNGAPYTAGNAEVTMTVGLDGWLTYRGLPYAWLIDLGSEKINPTVPLGKATYKVTYQGVKCGGRSVKFKDFFCHPLPGEDNYVTLMAELPAAPGVSIVRGPKGEPGDITPAAQAILDAAEALVISDLGTTDGQTRALIEAPASQTAVALSATYAAIKDPRSARRGYRSTTL